MIKASNRQRATMPTTTTTTLRSPISSDTIFLRVKQLVATFPINIHARIRTHTQPVASTLATNSWAAHPMIDSAHNTCVRIPESLQMILIFSVFLFPTDCVYTTQQKRFGRRLIQTWISSEALYFVRFKIVDLKKRRIFPFRYWREKR